jgi:large subunit ribosomal protein L9
MEQVIKVLGSTDVRIRLHPEVAVSITVVVARSLEEAEIGYVAEEDLEDELDEEFEGEEAEDEIEEDDAEEA